MSTRKKLNNPKALKADPGSKPTSARVKADP